MKVIKLLLGLIAVALTACHLACCGTAAPPDADFKALRDKLLSVPPLVPLLMLALFLASCTNRPFAILADGTKVSVGQSVATKTGTEASVAEVVTKDGKKIRLTYTSTALDETNAPGAYFLEKTTVGMGRIAGHSADVKQQQGTARAANARTPISSTSTGADGSTTTTVTQPATAVVPSIQ